jgi:voltage-gated potassium channel Kch
MHTYDLILTLTGGLSAALVLGYITQRLGLSPLVGYLLAGTLVGPHTPGFVADSALAEQLAEVGVILLMFGVGLQFHVAELLFFVSVGMLLDPWSVIASPALVLGALGIIFIGKPVAAFAIVWLMRYPFRVSLTVAVALAQVGEFSFMLSTIGRDLGVLSTGATNAVVAASIVSIVLNPLLYRAMPPIERWVSARPRLTRLLSRPAIAIDSQGPARSRVIDPSQRAVVVGYGPTGRTVVRLLRENGLIPTIIELNVDTVRELREQGIDAVYGDASQLETLTAADVAHAATLALTSPGTTDSAEVIRLAREQNPGLRVLARASYLRDLAALKAAGANTAYSGEGEVAVAFVEDILHALGATPDQIDRERERASGTGEGGGVGAESRPARVSTLPGLRAGELPRVQRCRLVTAYGERCGPPPDVARPVAERSDARPSSCRSSPRGSSTPRATRQRARLRSPPPGGCVSRPSVPSRPRSGRTRPATRRRTWPAAPA